MHSVNYIEIEPDMANNDSSYFSQTRPYYTSGPKM